MAEKRIAGSASGAAGDHGEEGQGAAMGSACAVVAVGAPGTIELPEGEIEGFEGYGHVTLEGAPNTRDLGGLRTRDGRMVRPHRLLRSGALHEMTRDDAELLCTWHQVRRVVDLRTTLERDGKPDERQLMPEVEFFDLPVLSATELTGASEGQGLSALDKLKAIREYLSRPYETMEGLYATALLGDQGLRSYGELLELLLDAPEGATLWHCTEGKDRAGLATVLVEHALGVPEQDIMRDYLATNLFVQTWAERVLDELARHRLLVRVDEDVSALFYANRGFLCDAMGLVKAEYGSIDGYLAKGLGFGPDKQEALRERYLTDDLAVPTVAKLPDAPPAGIEAEAA